MAVARSVVAEAGVADFIQADLTRPEGIRATVKAVNARLGGVDALVHVLGGSGAPGGRIATLGDDTWRAEIDLNLMAAVRVLLPQMIECGYPCVVDPAAATAESTIAYAADGLQDGALQGSSHQAECGSTSSRRDGSIPRPRTR